MANDIEGLVERLHNPSWNDCNCHLIMDEAAATITALQADVERLRGLLREARPKIAQPSARAYRFADDYRFAINLHDAFLARIDKELNHEG